MTPMQPEMPKAPLADQPWFVDLLAAKGFYRASSTAFTNGKASIQVDGSRLVADPGTGDRTWNSDLDEAERIVSELVRRTPPSHAHTELADLLSRFAAAKREIRAQEPTQ